MNIQDKPRMRGRFQVEHYNKDGKLLGTYDIPNGIVDEGIHYLMDVGFGAGSQITTWYIGLVDNAGFSAFDNGDTMGSHAGWAESTAYTEAVRQEWTEGSAASRSITNATTVDFSIDATVTLHGIFIVSDNTKGGTTGTLWSTAAFASNVTANNGDILKVTYSLSG